MELILKMFFNYKNSNKILLFSVKMYIYLKNFQIIITKIFSHPSCIDLKRNYPSRSMDNINTVNFHL
jgi:hypothetical protein